MGNARLWVILIGALAAASVSGCGDDDGGAIARGIGAECSVDMDCTEMGQHCLGQFKGGYCGATGCTHDIDCPSGSACVTDDDGANYCFLVCADKPECNVTRTLDNESNCVASIPFVDGAMGRKVCRPPLSGTGTDAGPGTLDAATAGDAG